MTDVGISWRPCEMRIVKRLTGKIEFHQRWESFVDKTTKVVALRHKPQTEWRRVPVFLEADGMDPKEPVEITE